MASWGKADAASSAPLWACHLVNLAPTASNRTNLFEDADADNFISGVTIGLFNYADGEVPAGAAHAGWNLKVTGSGGRASRVIYTTLVALTDAA
jgi:hypothetical protein